MNNIQKFFNNAAKNDARSRSRITPERILWESPGTNGQSAFLLNSECVQATVCDSNTSFRLEGGILIDYGRELYGGIEIIAGDNCNNDEIALNIRFGESASEAMQNSVHSHVIQNSVLKVPSNGSVETSLCGFRFVFLEVANENSYVDLKAVNAILYYRDYPYQGSFECSDPILNDIWATGAYTVHLNMQEYLWDGIKRDRLVWAGDIHPAVMVINTVFGDVDIVPKTLDYLRQSTPMPQFMNNFCAYSIWWLITVRDWYLYQGDMEFLKKQKDYIIDLLNLLKKHVDDNGVECLEKNRFLDWNTCGDDPAIHAGLQALMVNAFMVGASLLTKLGCIGEAECAIQMTTCLQKYVPASNNKQAVALQVLSGQRTAYQANLQCLADTPLQGLSPFYGYYILNARGAAGDIKGGVDLIKKYWGGMLQLGATTFWESFDMSWLKNAGRIDELNTDKVDVHKTYGEHCYKGYRHSLCHAWSAGPTAWLSQYILGVTPTKSGSAEVIIQPPPLSDLGLEFAKGTFPTPHGILHVNHELTNNEVRTRVKAPSQVNVIIKECSLCVN